MGYVVGRKRGDGVGWGRVLGGGGGSGRLGVVGLLGIVGCVSCGFYLSCGILTSLLAAGRFRYAVETDLIT